MTTGWSHPKGLSPAQVLENATLEEEARKTTARIDAMRPTGKHDTSGYDVFGNPEVTGSSTNRGSSSGSVSRSFDYTGMDEAAKVAQAVQAAKGSFVDVALSDPMKIPALQNSIRSMQQYLDAYNSGNGLPPVRVSSESISSSSSPGSTSKSFGRKKLASHVLLKKDADEQGGPQQPAPPAQEPLVDVRGHDNQQAVNDAVFNIPPNADRNHDPMTRRHPLGGEMPRITERGDGPKQGPSMPPHSFPNLEQAAPRTGIMKSTNENKVFGKDDYTSIWDLEYYV